MSLQAVNLEDKHCWARWKGLLYLLSTKTVDQVTLQALGLANETSSEANSPVLSAAGDDKATGRAWDFCAVNTCCQGAETPALELSYSHRAGRPDGWRMFLRGTTHNVGG